MPDFLSFDFHPVTNKKVKSLNANKATGPDGIPLKLIKLSANVVEKYPTSMINHDILQSYISNGGMNTLVRPTYKEKDYSPVSILNEFSKVYERFINDSIIFIAQNFLSSFVSAYEKYYSANNVLISLIENWKKNLHIDKTVDALFMDLSKAFEYIPHYLPMAKMGA